MTAKNTETPLVNNTGMDYNTDQPKMSISEYGRNVYRMIDHCLTIEDREERNRCARTIVKVMAILNPSLKDFSDFEHKLWDHLFIISDYKLDVDAPFPKPEPELFHSKPEALKYPQGDIRFKHYGKNLEALIQKEKTLPELEQGFGQRPAYRAAA
ncbi:MAG: hypothetical protein FD123_1461 [Bacteroidetes bacterium]|nr:MAG: hypothetical protein FD123_1461 [Bacteroidota bacterium]